jgi:translation initiation factor IF-1
MRSSERRRVQAEQKYHFYTIVSSLRLLSLVVLLFAVSISFGSPRPAAAWTLPSRHGHERVATAPAAAWILSAAPVSKLQAERRGLYLTSVSVPVDSAPRILGPSSRAATALFGKKEARAAGNERKSKTPGQERRANKKSKDDVIEVEGVVVESLPNAMFRCSIDTAGGGDQPTILATISGKIRKNFVKILVGDKVTIELVRYKWRTESRRNSTIFCGRLPP